MTGLVKQPAHRVAVVVRRKQAQDPVGCLTIIMVAGVFMRGSRFVLLVVHHPVHQSLGLGQQQGAGKHQQQAGPCAPRQRQSGHHRRSPLPYLTLTASVTR